MERRWITVLEAADILGVQRATFYGKTYRKEFNQVPAHEIPVADRVGPTHLVRFYFDRTEIEAAAQAAWRDRLLTTDGRSPSVEDCAYLAGLFDGEGCVTIRKRPPQGPPTHYILGTSVVNTYSDALIWIRDTFGGALNSRQPPGNAKRTWTWIASCGVSYRMLQRISPFLRIKHQQAAIAIGFYERVVAYNGSRYHPLDAEELAWRQEQYEAVRRLNRRGPPVALVRRIDV